MSCDRLGELRAATNRSTGWSGAAPVRMTVNHLGVMTDTDFYRGEDGAFAKPAHEQHYAAVVAGARTESWPPPDVSNGEAFFEIAAVMRSVLAAKKRFVVVELGGGFGARAVDALAALRQFNPLPATAVVVEPIQGHLDFARRHFTNNGFTTDGHWFLAVAVAADTKPLFMPLNIGRYGNTAESTPMYEYLIRAIHSSFDTAKKVINILMAHKKIALSVGDGNKPETIGIVSALTLDDILFPFDVVDLIDMDIQCAEDAVVPASINVLNKKVKLLNIGTHEAGIHDRLRALLSSAGWSILADYPPHADFDTPYGSFRTGDGVLMVENPRAASMEHQRS
jgi:hypothetical protein